MLRRTDHSGLGFPLCGCPAWIRTRTKASKGPCATVTPPDKTGLSLAFRHIRRKGKDSSAEDPQPLTERRFATKAPTFCLLASSFLRPAVCGAILRLLR